MIIVSYPVQAADQAMAMECRDVHVDSASPSILSPANTFTIIGDLYQQFMIIMAIGLIIQYDITTQRPPLRKICDHGQSYISLVQLALMWFESSVQHWWVPRLHLFYTTES